MPEDVIYRIHELAIANISDVDNRHDEILDSDQSDGNEDPNESPVTEVEYNCEDTTEYNRIEPFPDPMV